MKIVKDYDENTAEDVVEVTSANHIAEYKIKVSFSDGIEKSVDFSSFLVNALHPSIAKYRNVELFKKFQIVNGNINWNDYDLIFPIVDLHDGIIK